MRRACGWRAPPSLCSLGSLSLRGSHLAQPDSEAGRQHALTTLDFKTGSTLLVRGRANLHALHEFLINARPSAHSAAFPYFLSLQLLAPVPFAHGVPHAARAVHQSSRRVAAGAPAAAPAANSFGGGGGGGGSEVDIVRLEEADRHGCGALLLPCCLRRLVALLQRSQEDGFELLTQPDPGGASHEAINLRPQGLVRPHDIGMVPARRMQPTARLSVPVPKGAVASPPGDMHRAGRLPLLAEDSQAVGVDGDGGGDGNCGGGEPAETIRHIGHVAFRDGALRIM